MRPTLSVLACMWGKCRSTTRSFRVCWRNARRCAAPLRAVRSTGTVNAIYRLGDEHYVRLPRLEQYARRPAQGVRVAAAPGRVDADPRAGVRGRARRDDYPFPWAVFRWIEGEPYDRRDGRARRGGSARAVRAGAARDRRDRRAPRRPGAAGRVGRDDPPAAVRRRARRVGAGARSARLGRRADLDPRRPAAAQPARRATARCAP